MKKIEDTFDSDNKGWSGGFADYPEGEEEFYELEYKRISLPNEINSNKKGLYLSGNNHSDDLFMYIKKKIDTFYKLKPNTFYNIVFDFDIATNTPAGAVGVGGAPGEGVTVKAGATIVEPAQVIRDGEYRMNIEIGSQANAGKDVIVLGNLAKLNGVDFSYELKNFKNEDPFTVQTDEKGELWLIIGTDSGFEATTSIYIPRIKVLIT